MPSTKLIVFELNEVPYKVIEDFANTNPNSQWSKVMKKGARFNVMNDDSGHLHPKISWQTFHRGVIDKVHKIFEFNQNEPETFERYPTFIDILRKQGVKVGCGASIGSYPIPKSMDNIDFYLPDVFSPSCEAYPAYLEPFQRFNTNASQASGRVVRKGLPIGDAIKMLTRWFSLGITAKIVYKIVNQLITERVDRKRIVRRRTIQALLSFDVSLKQVKRFKPGIVTLFSNHVASSMHRYWAAKFEDDFIENKMPRKWRDDYKHEIDYAMEEADYMLKELLNFSKRNPEYLIMCIGSIGQDGIEHEVTYNQLIISDFDKFMTALGFPRYKKLAGMEPLYILELPNKEQCIEFIKTVTKIKIGDYYARATQLNDTQVKVNVAQYNIDFTEANVDGWMKSFASLGLEIEPIQDLAPSTAQHVPESMCLVCHGSLDLSKFSHERIINLTQVTSSILSAFDCKIPKYMPTPDQGLVDSLTYE